MKCYLLLMRGSFAKWNELSKEKKAEVVGQFEEFAKSLGESGYMRGGDSCSERSFRLLDSTAAGGDSLVDPKTPDMVTGYFLIQVPNEEVALQVAKSCPAFNCGEHVELVPCADH